MQFSVYLDNIPGRLYELLAALIPRIIIVDCMMSNCTKVWVIFNFVPNDPDLARDILIQGQWTFIELQDTNLPGVIMTDDSLCTHIEDVESDNNKIASIISIPMQRQNTHILVGIEGDNDEINRVIGLLSQDRRFNAVPRDQREVWLLSIKVRPNKLKDLFCSLGECSNPNVILLMQTFGIAICMDISASNLSNASSQVDIIPSIRSNPYASLEQWDEAMQCLQNRNIFESFEWQKTIRVMGADTQAGINEIKDIAKFLSNHRVNIETLMPCPDDSINGNGIRYTLKNPYTLYIDGIRQ